MLFLPTRMEQMHKPFSMYGGKTTDFFSSALFMIFLNVSIVIIDARMF